MTERFRYSGIFGHGSAERGPLNRLLRSSIQAVDLNEARRSSHMVDEGSVLGYDVNVVAVIGLLVNRRGPLVI